MSLSAVTGARLAGLAAGLCLVGLVALQAWRVPAAPRPAESRVALRALSTGSVGVVEREGGMTLRNQTAGPLSVRARVAGGDPGLDREVAVELRIDGRVAYRGPLGRLRSGDGVVVARMARGATAPAKASARVPVGVDARRLTLTFEGGR